jgi:hypothetical protein
MKTQKGLLVSTEPFAAIVRRWVDNRQRMDEEVSRDDLASELGISTREIWELMNNRTQRMEFAKADKIVTMTIGPMAWWTNEDLNEIYLEADLEKLDLTAPLNTPEVLRETAEKVVAIYEENGSVIRYAARKVRVSDKLFASMLDRSLEELGNDPRVERTDEPWLCPKGHDKNVVGIYSNYACRECTRLKLKAKRLAKKEVAA